jgi:hypothetical protein
LRKATILSFSPIYLLPLIYYSNHQEEIQRETYLRLICQSWSDFIQKKCRILQDIFKSPSEWTELLENETKSFSVIFIQSGDLLSQNKALCENILQFSIVRLMKFLFGILINLVIPDLLKSIWFIECLLKNKVKILE